MRKMSKAQARSLVRRAKLGNTRKQRPQVALPAPCLAASTAVRRRMTIEAPACLDIDKNSAEVIEFLSMVRERAAEQHRGTLVVDLSPVRELDLAAAVALVAEFDRWQRYRGLRLHPTTINTWDETVRTHLAMLGFFSLLKTEVPRHLTQGRSADVWIPVTSGVLTVGVAAKKLRVGLERQIWRTYWGKGRDVCVSGGGDEKCVSACLSRRSDVE